MKKNLTLGIVTLLFAIISVTISSCAKERGCVDPFASNYKPSAQEDDGSCMYVIRGCTDNSSPNYNSSAQSDDGSCIDLPTSSGILGYYIGGVNDSFASGSIDTYSQEISITKIDNSHILVSAYNGGILYNFTAKMYLTSANTYLITIPYQTTDGVTLSGNTLIMINGTAYHGTYNPSTRQFASATTFIQNGETAIEFYLGAHQ